MSTEQELRQKLRKIAALFEGATTLGEQDAAAAAIERVRAALRSAEQKEKSVETDFRLPDRWSRRLLPRYAVVMALRPTVIRASVTPPSFCAPLLLSSTTFFGRSFLRSRAPSTNISMKPQSASSAKKSSVFPKKQKSGLDPQ